MALSSSHSSIHCHSTASLNSRGLCPMGRLSQPEAVRGSCSASVTSSVFIVARHCHQQLGFWTRISETSNIQDAASVSQVMTPDSRILFLSTGSIVGLDLTSLVHRISRAGPFLVESIWPLWPALSHCLRVCFTPSIEAKMLLSSPIRL